ncbi:MAG: BamA/TamA family outer membrane protein [bacterium]|nr:MAG: BamA/TamA family outer membrane protein [bacterium]
MRFVQYGRFAVTALVPLFACTSVVLAQTNSRSDSLQQKRSSLVALPYAYYSPETKIAFGVGTIYSFRPKGGSPEDRPSNIRIALTYTQLKQGIIGFLPELYFRNESYYITGYYGFYRYPDKFWGIGNDTPDSAEEAYKPVYFKSYTSLQRRIVPGLYIGIRSQYEYIDLRETSEDGALQSGTIPGSEGGSALGLGVIVNHDTRNHIYQPSTGFFNQIYAVFFGKAIASDYTFNVLSIDLRKYFSVFGTHVIALQTYDSFISGKPPFQMLNMLGGSSWMRGYYLGRYRDKNMITFQAEYRFPVYWRLGAVGFVGFGDVSNDARKFQMDELKYSLGFGIRFMFDRQERINARLDFGFGRGGKRGMYAFVTEAF